MHSCICACLSGYTLGFVPLSSFNSGVETGEILKVTGIHMRLVNYYFGNYVIGTTDR